MSKRKGRIGQVKVYFGKCARLYLNERQWKNLISAVIIMILIMAVTGNEMFDTYQDTLYGGFAVTCACIWIGLFNSLRSICRERDVVKREHRAGLHISSYITAHMAFEVIQSAIEALIVTIAIVIRYRDNLPVNGVIISPSVDLFITFFMITYSADVLGIMLSSIVKSENSAMTVMPFILIIQIVMSGAVFDLDGITKKLSALTISRWGLDAIGAIASKNGSIETSRRTQEAMTRTKIVVDHWDPTMGNLLLLWGILLLFILIYGLIGIIFLEGIDNDKR